MREVHLSNARWRTSSHSDQHDGDCVEVAEGAHGAVPVRDSKMVDGPVLVVGAAAWTHFLTGITTPR
ncbi:DUF397 domain-containing protein [Streptomyces sp. G45]|uniref:DUF397 domain-containing protein n=1 Tax=Streptomyces sp. G45 TaxID=3406627 RepID=UPI003C22250A